MRRSGWARRLRPVNLAIWMRAGLIGPTDRREAHCVVTVCPIRDRKMASRAGLAFRTIPRRPGGPDTPMLASGL